MHQAIPLQLILGFVVFVGMVAAVMIGMTVSDSMQLEEYVQIGVVFLPLILVAVLGLRRLWLGVILGLLMLAMSLPVRFLSQFPLVMTMSMLISAFVIGGYCMKFYQRPVVHNLGGAMILVSGAFVVARFIKDRPSSAFLGGSGGGGQMLVVLFSFVIFWAISKYSSEPDWNPMRVLQVAFVLLLISYVHRLINLGVFGQLSVEDQIGGDVGSGLMMNLYSKPSWMLGSIILAWVLYRFGPGSGPLMLNQNMFLVIMTLMGTAAVAGNRSRPLFAIGTILMVSYIFRQHWRALGMLAVTSVVALMLILSVGNESLPPQMRRTLSTILPVSEQEAQEMSREARIGGEMGWESEFRTMLYELAWDKIKENPVFGAGFSFSSSDLVKLFAVGGGGMESSTIKAAMVGAYHNSLLQLAVGAGIPAAVLFFVGSLIIIIRAVRLAAQQEDPQMVLFIAFILGSVPPLYGQALMNGGGADLFRVAVLLAILNGIVVNPRFQAKEERAPETVRDRELEAAPAGAG